MKNIPVSIHVLDSISSEMRLSLLERTESDIGRYFAEVELIVEEVRLRGDAALVEFAARFDDAVLKVEDLKVSAEEFENAIASLTAELKTSLQFAAENIERFHGRQMPDSLSLHETHPGIIVGDRWTPIDSVACYIPRGKGSFPSSVLMTAIPARVAGTARVIIITPPGADGSVDAATLFAARLSGITEVYKCGGAQAIAAVAYGTSTVPKCRKVVGPGSPWVVAAKKLLSSVIDPGSPAGPSELIVFSDGTVSPEIVALDLCVESEHGPDSSVFLVTTDAEFAQRVASCLPDMWARMSESRAHYSKTVLSGTKGGIVIAASMSEAFAFINDYAPEHLAVLAQDSWKYLQHIKHAGEILLGPYTAIALANYVLGPSHVLPTGGAAATASPISVFDFMKRSSVASVTAEGYAKFAKNAENIARYEGFDAHANSVSRLRRDIIN